jgi:3-oxoacyl-[acyl-carrier-protein] synthase II
MSAVTSLGLDEATLWRRMLAGESGIAPIRAFDPAEYRTKVAAEVDDAALTAAMGARGIPSIDRAVDMGVLAAGQALEQAGLVSGAPPYAPRDMATIFACHGSYRSLYTLFHTFFEKGPRAIRPTSLPRHIPNATSAQISMRYRLTGANYVVSAACSASTTAIGLAFRMIQDGYADRAVCGGTDSTLDPFIFSGWNILGVMSRNPDPRTACRPFDATRDGCVLGEGAGALVLEALPVAVARGARIRAEVAGYGEGSDAAHITQPDAEGQARSIRAALQNAGVAPAEIGHINAHGTATRTNDTSEAQAIRLSLGDAADAIPVASNKSFFGHLLGAAGAVETVVSVLALENGVVPPSLNMDTPDPECRLRFVGRSPEPLARPVVLKNSFGFGGHNAVLVLRAAPRG